MSQLLKLLIITLLALIATHPSPMIQASPIDPYNQPAPSLAPDQNMINNNDPDYSPSPSYEDDLSPEPQYPNDEDDQDMSPEYPSPSPSPSPSPLAYAPDIEQDYPYAENPSFSPSHAEDVDDDDYYSPYGAPTPSPTESMYSAGISNATSDDVMDPQVDVTPPVLPFNYSAEDDSGEVISEDYDEEGYPELKKKNRAVIGFVLGAICLVGLGGLVYKNQKKNQKRDYPMYMELSKKSDV